MCKCFSYICINVSNVYAYAFQLYACMFLHVLMQAFHISFLYKRFH